MANRESAPNYGCLFRVQNLIVNLLSVIFILDNTQGGLYESVINSGKTKLKKNNRRSL